MVRRHGLVLVAVIALVACTVIGGRGPLHQADRATVDDARAAALVVPAGLAPAVQAVRGSEGDQQTLRLTGLVLVAMFAVAAVGGARRRFLGWTDGTDGRVFTFARVTPARAPPALRLPAS